MKTIRLLAALFLCAALLPLHAQDATEPEIHKRDQPADATELDAIAQRGRAIANYDKAAWYGTDAVKAIHPNQDNVQMYIGQHTSAGWVIAFGKLSPAKDSFLLAYKATSTADVKHPQAEIEKPPSEEHGLWLQEARAYDLAREQFYTTKPTASYNGAIFPTQNGEWYVYFYPAQTDLKVFPTGADIRYRVSSDGTKILETHRMHISLLQNDFSKIKPEMTYHTAILDDAPEDTDAANAIMMGGVPMIIMGHNFVYEIAADGTPKYISTIAEFMKAMKN